MYLKEKNWKGEIVPVAQHFITKDDQYPVGLVLFNNSNNVLRQDTDTDETMEQKYVKNMQIVYSSFDIPNVIKKHEIRGVD